VFIFVIDTEQYSGNFEREMCAYATGQYGECGVGDDMAKLFDEEVDLPENLFDLIVVQVPDEHGACRPCKIYPTPGWFNNGMGGHYREGQEVEALEHRNEQYLEHSKRKNAPKDWATKGHEPLGKYPAYLSVAIFFDKRPADQLIELMKIRAKEFTLKKPARFQEPDITITGFRLLEEKTTTEVIEL